MKRARPFGLAFFVAALVMPVATTVAQVRAVPVVRLEPADATLETELDGVYSLRELRDGVVLVVDRIANRLVAVDFRDQGVRQIGRIGAGPGEMRYFGRLFPLGGDSSLLVEDDRGRRWLILRHDTIVATVRPDDPMLKVSQGSPRGVAADGSVAVTVAHRGTEAPQRNGMRQIDSVLIVVAHKGLPRRDTIGWIEEVDHRVVVTKANGKPYYIVTPARLSVSDAAMLAPDGWMAVVSQRPYRVTWRTPEGRTIRGPDLQWPRIPVDARVRREYVAWLSRRGPQQPISDDGWAEVIPPFAGAIGALIAPDGSLLLRKQWQPGATETHYDVIDRQGRIVADIVIPEREMIVGFGAQSVYTIRRDDDDLVWLSRHPWRGVVSRD